MAKHKARYLITRELARASNNLDMCMNHLISIRTSCKDGHRPDLMPLVDKIGEGALALQQTIIAFKAMIDGKIPVSGPDPRD